MGGVAAGGVLCAGFAAGEDEAGGHALDVPLEWAADGLVEVVDVEDETAVGRGEGAEVAYVGVAAELGKQSGVGAERERSEAMMGTAPRKKPKGDAAMRSYLMEARSGDAAADGVGEELERVGGAGAGLPAGVVGAAHVLAVGLAEGEALAEGQGDGHG